MEGPQFSMLVAHAEEIMNLVRIVMVTFLGVQRWTVVNVLEEKQACLLQLEKIVWELVLEPLPLTRITNVVCPGKKINVGYVLETMNVLIAMVFQMEMQNLTNVDRVLGGILAFSRVQIKIVLEFALELHELTNVMFVLEELQE